MNAQDQPDMLCPLSVEIFHKGHSYGADVNCARRVIIFRNNHSVCSGRYITGSGIVDCPAVIPEDAYALLDHALGVVYEEALQAAR